MIKDNLYLTAIIKEIDNLPCSHPASVNIDVANYYYSLTKMVRPLLIVEIGCFIGFSTLHFAQALREQGFGKMISIDAFSWEVNAGQGLENRYDVARRYLKKAELEDIVHYIKGYSTDVYSDIETQIKFNIDLLYIDGDHSAKGVFKDFNIYYNDVRVGGYILLHDIYPEMCGEFGPRVLIDHLKSKGLIPNMIELIELPTRDGFGVSVLRKISKKPLELSVPITDTPKTLLKRGVRKLRSKYKAFRKMPNANRHKGIQIKIVDDSNHKPIVGANLTCHQRWNEKRISDRDGIINFEHYLPNRYQFDIIAEGYANIDNFLIDVVSQPGLQQFIIKLKKN